MLDVRRRQMLGGAATWPLVARAQSEVHVIGFLTSLSSDYASYMRAAFRQGVTETGFAEGHSVKYEYRYANSRRSSPSPTRSGLSSSSDGAFAVVLALWSLLRLSLRRGILSGELRARFRPISRRFDFGRTQRSCIPPWLILRRRTQIFWIALWNEFV